MALTQVSEADFKALAMGANYAADNGDRETALALDKLARKTNASLTRAATRKFMGKAGFPVTTVSWQDVPSTLEGRPDYA